MTDIEKMKVRLSEELTMLEAELMKIGRRNPSNPADWEARAPSAEDVEADLSEAADRIEEFEERTSILKELEARYNNVKLALEKIEKGTYGVCEIGGEPIEDARLEANPAARTCEAHMEG